ncbi:MAG: hypothetical protein IJ302_06775, partial [Clostridia bacterium]|nr:hypothetical protein [Clostridia bacterium]
MVKRMMALLLSAMMIAGAMTGCGSANDGNSDNKSGGASVNDVSGDNAGSETPSVITVNTVYGDVEIPYAPKRVCILDMNTLDMMHSFKLMDNVVSLV